MKGLLRGLSLAAILSACLVSALVAQGLPWYRVRQSEAYVDQRLAAGFVQDEKAWHRNDDRLLETTHLTSLDAKVWWELGEMHYLRAEGLRLWPEKQREEQHIARGYYFSALERSPGNGVLLARASSRLAYAGDRSAIGLMRLALRIAPYEPAAQYPLAEAGMLLWNEMGPDLRVTFKAMITQAMRDPKTSSVIKELAKENKWSSVLATL